MWTQRPGREPHKSDVVPAASKKPVRAKPMRGSGAEDAADSAKVGVARARAPVSQAPLAHAEAQTKTKEDFCAHLLLGGYVQAFVDFFYLTHRSEPATINSTTHSSSAVFAAAELEFLRDQLVAAEHCKRKGEILDVLAAYENLATYCHEKHDVQTMLFFYSKCLDIARLVKDPVCEMRVLSQLGAGYHALSDLEKARESHESHVAIAQVVYAHEDDEELRSDAFKQLGRVYRDLAKQSERAQRFQDAIDWYKKLLDCASSASDDDAAAYAQLQIGVCYNACAQPTNALPFLESYLTTCRKTGNVDGEGSACAELATAHEQLANQQLSIDFLTHYVAIATRAENVSSQADACRRLGHIYTLSQDFARAREMHEKSYALLPAVVAQTQDATALNCARVTVGAARANDKLAAFLALVAGGDVRGLLEWKNARALPSAE